MKITKETLSPEISRIIDTYIPASKQESSVFFDIETTGLSPKNAAIYLIGAAAFENGGWVLRQWFAENLAEEEAVLSAFIQYLQGDASVPNTLPSQQTSDTKAEGSRPPFTRLIHFNGTTFDIPFVQARSKKYGLDAALSEMDQLDIYRQISPFKNILKLSNCKQKTLEEFLGIFREDPFNGGQLIEVYHAYRTSRDPRLLQVLLLHNAEDIKGMLMILPVLAYPMMLEESFSNAGLHFGTKNSFCSTDIAAAPQAEPIASEEEKQSSDRFHSIKAVVESGKDYRGNDRKELFLTFDLPFALPVEFATNKNGIFFTAKGTKAAIKIPVFCGELKYFYPDHKNYSYLPAEDNAIHKSVAVYVDKAHRIPATPETCYTRKSGEFAPCFAAAYESHVFHCVAPRKKSSSSSQKAASAKTASAKEISTKTDSAKMSVLKSPKESSSGAQLLCNDYLLLDEAFLTDFHRLSLYADSLLLYLLK